MKRNSALFALSLILMITPTIAVSGDRFFVAQGPRGIAHAAEYGSVGHYIHPFDDGYDYPFGYGEYAEYGPWAYRADAANCFLRARKVWSGKNWRVQRAWICP
jgi:hypothetical protein